MKGRNIFITGAAISAIGHCALIFGVNLHVQATSRPVIYCWPNILSERELFMRPSSGHISQKLPSGFTDMDRDLFPALSTTRPINDQYILSEDDSYFASGAGNIAQDAHDKLKPKVDHWLLWKRPAGILGKSTQETIPYKTFVSPYGKIVMSYPQRLPVNSEENLYLQEYLRESALFFSEDSPITEESDSKNGKFFWTNLDGVLE